MTVARLFDAPSAVTVTATVYSGATVVAGPVTAVEMPLGVYSATFTPNIPSGAYTIQWKQGATVLASDDFTASVGPSLATWTPPVFAPSGVEPSSVAAPSATADVYEELPFVSTGTVDVSINGPAGTFAATATYQAAEFAWHVVVPAAATTQPGLVLLTWTHSDGSEATTGLDVRGANPWPVAALERILERGGGTYETPRKIRALTASLLSLESACGVCLVTKRSVFTIPDSGVLNTGLEGVTQVLSEDGEAAVSVAGVLTGTPGSVVFVDHGYTALTAEAQRVVAILASSQLADGPWDDRGFAATDGGGTIRLLTAGVGGARYSIPEVQEFYRRTRRLLVR